MVIYVDMLIIVNFVADYFLLKATAAILRVPLPFWRNAITAIFASLFSLYIFLPQHSVLLQILSRLIFCAVIVLCGFGFKSKFFYFKACLLFFGVTFLFAGGMAAVYTLLKPGNMAVRNTVVYFNISPIVLILSSAAFYVVLQIWSLLFPRTKADNRCRVVLFLENKQKTFSGLVDTGNSLKDPFFESEVIIINENDAKPITEGLEDQKARFCLLPCTTVSGTALLKGIRLDKAVVHVEKRSITLKQPVAAFSAEPIEKDTAIVNPEDLL